MTRVGNKRGFTLVEMLVVISIIVVLVAILVPVIQSSRHKARMTKCQTNMQKLVSAMTEYKRKYNKFPPRPIYDSDEELYIGGFSALYPRFVDSWDYFVCPDDQSIYGRQEEAKARHYCTYNGRINLADDPASSDPWEFATDADTGHLKITYNWNGYDHKGWDRTLPGDPPTDDPIAPPDDAKPGWLERGWKYYPRLSNRYAPEYTMVTHCTMHRDFYHEEQDVRDTMIRLSNDMDTIPVQVWQDQSDGASLFEKQD
jgi:prepilin-type N-terminal cleavage/methylation domain-containing protein